jgi:hypothetical protein
VDEIQSVHIWNAYTQKMTIDRTSNFDNSIFTSLSTITNVRDFYFSQRHYTWKILGELLRIERDESHLYNAIAYKYLDSLIKQ